LEDNTAPSSGNRGLLKILDRRIVFVGGKGGVGKTTIASALAVAAADRGTRCLLVSTDPAHSLGDIFARTIGPRETTIVSDLWALEIDPDAEARAHIQTVKQNMKSLVRPALYHEVDRQLDLARHAPGAAEAALLERVAVLMDEGLKRYDLIIFDTAPTGHTIRLLSLPEVMAAWTDGLLHHQSRSDHLGKLWRRLGGGQARGDDLSYLADHQDAAGEKPQGEESESETPTGRIKTVLLARRRIFQRARRLLLDPGAFALLVVLTPERLPILESRRAIETLARFDVPVSALVTNRVLPEDADGAFLRRRQEQQAVYLNEIDATFAHLPRYRLPLLEQDVHGLEALQRVARHFGG